VFAQRRSLECKENGYSSKHVLGARVNFMTENRAVFLRAPETSFINVTRVIVSCYTRLFYTATQNTHPAVRRLYFPADFKEAIQRIRAMRISHHPRRWNHPRANLPWWQSDRSLNRRMYLADLHAPLNAAVFSATATFIIKIKFRRHFIPTRHESTSLRHLAGLTEWRIKNESQIKVIQIDK